MHLIFLANIRYFNYNYNMKKGIYILPNGLTLCGMFFGFYAILSAIKGNYVHAAWAIMIANVFDGLDGWVARLTHSTTRFGIELDSEHLIAPPDVVRWIHGQQIITLNIAGPRESKFTEGIYRDAYPGRCFCFGSPRYLLL